MCFVEIVMSVQRQIKFVLLALGVALLIWGLFIAVRYTFQMNSDREWGERYLLYDLGFIAMGVAFELLGLGLIVISKKSGVDRTITS